MQTITIVSLGILAFAVGAVAVDPAFGQTVPLARAADPTECPLDGYQGITLPLDLPIPDIGELDPIGPIQFLDDGGLIEDVVMQIEIQHTWVGNLVVTITYDVECDGSNVVGPVRLLCRQGLDGCPEEHACCGCHADLVVGASYFFADHGAKEMANDDAQCSRTVEPGCYRPASESEFELSVFDGLPMDGCWLMRIYDGAGGDIGIIHSWSVHVLEAAVPIEPGTWGSIKTQYRDRR